VIALFYNARDRGTGLVLSTIDWRVLVIIFLMCYNTLQARPPLGDTVVFYKPVSISADSRY
jgi:hypothetical protein